MKAIDPYVFPGIQGTMERPFPSGYPTPMEVLDVCCRVFDTYGRACGAYRSEWRRGVVVTPDAVLMRNRNLVIMDVRRIAIVIITEHLLWRRSPRAHLERYTHRFTAHYFGLSCSKVTYHRERAAELLASDSCFRYLYFLCLDRLHCSFRLELSREHLEELRERAA